MNMDPNNLILNIKKNTLNNDYYRRVIFTSKNIQLVLMSLLPGEDIPMEVHKGDQVVHIEQGTGIVTINNKTYFIITESLVIIPAGSSHYFKNIGKNKMKLYSIYSPPEHSLNGYDITKPKN